MIRKYIQPAIVSFLILTVITGVLYPFFITCIAHVFFYKQSHGSLVYQNNQPVGSMLIGQPFDDPRYFWGRPSSTSPVRYNAAASSGSNMGPLNPLLIEVIRTRVNMYESVDPDNKNPIPVDLVTSSGSGLDPHISVAGAYYQVPRIARVRGLPQDIVKKLVQKHTHSRLFGFIGEPVVTILALNIDLDNCSNKETE